MQGRMKISINFHVRFISKNEAMQNDECNNRWDSFDINCFSPCIVTNKSSSVPSDDLMSYGNHFLDLALKSPNIMVKNVLSFNL